MIELFRRWFGTHRCHEAETRTDNLQSQLVDRRKALLNAVIELSKGVDDVR